MCIKCGGTMERKSVLEKGFDEKLHAVEVDECKTCGRRLLDHTARMVLEGNYGPAGSGVPSGRLSA